jgi:uncharacterized membrane protein (DUF485 family)
MDQSVINTLILCIAFGIVFGPLTARSARRREPIYGGLLAEALSFIGSMTMVCVVPGVLGAIIFGAGPLRGLIIGVSFLLTTFILMLAFAIIEKAPRDEALARQAAEAESRKKRGWTEEDARTSGL